MLRTATQPEGAVTPLRTPDVVMNPGFVESCLISNKAECNCRCAVLSLVPVRIFPLILAPAKSSRHFFVFTLLLNSPKTIHPGRRIKSWKSESHPPGATQKLCHYVNFATKKKMRKKKS